MKQAKRLRVVGLRLFEVIEDVLAHGAMLSMVAILVLVSAEVIGRSFFSVSFEGVYGLTGLLMVTLVWGALSVIQRTDRHLKMDLLKGRTEGKRYGYILNSVMLLMTIALCIIVCYAAIRLTMEFHRTGASTAAYNIPYIYTAPFVPIGMALMCGRCVIMLSRNIRLAFARRPVS